MFNLEILKTTAILVVFALVGTGLVAFSYEKTKERIKYNEQQALLRDLNDLIPKALYDNELTKDTIEIVNIGQLGSRDPVTIYRARKQQQPVAIAFKPIANDGYSGAIQLLVAIRYDGSLLGVRIVSHKETPGLGDKIHQKRGDWIHSFKDKSLTNPDWKQWSVKRDGGDFDQFTGATISPRAVVNAVKRSLEFYQVHYQRLFQPQS